MHNVPEILDDWSLVTNLDILQNLRDAWFGTFWLQTDRQTGFENYIDILYSLNNYCSL